MIEIKEIYAHTRPVYKIVEIGDKFLLLNYNEFTKVITSDTPICSLSIEEKNSLLQDDYFFPDEVEELCEKMFKKLGGRIIKGDKNPYVDAWMYLVENKIVAIDYSKLKKK